MIRSPNTSFLPTLPFLLLLFLLTAQAAQPRFLAQTCNSSCGELTGITYPFRLTTDPPGCGDADYEISCENDKPTLQFHSGKYHVRRISYGSRTIRVVDPSFFAANGTCIGLPSQSLSVMELNEDPRYRGFASNIETSFVRCSGNITIQSYRRVPCLSDDDGLNSVYVSYGTYIISGLKGPCSFLARVPTIYQAVMGPSYENIMLLLQEGFDLGWSVECRDCLARGHECVMTGYDTPFTYECRSPEYYIYGVVSFFARFLSSVFFDITLVARFVLAPMVVFGFLIHKYRTTAQKSTVTEMVVAKGKFVAVPNSSFVPRRYSYADIVVMTGQFRDKIGRGRFGTVFKGKLPDGGLVAVKVLGDPIKFTGDDFANEISVIARVHHNNVVRLLGVCSEGSHNVLVSDYIPNGSLDKYIASREEGIKLQPLSWEQLLQIALGTARGIRHLHDGCDSCILHLDIKSRNVLLTMVLFQKLQTLGCPNSITRREMILSRWGFRELISSMLHQKCSQMAWEMFRADQTFTVSGCCCLKWSKGNGWPNRRGNLLPKCTSPCGFMII
ncbi:unnamed protein product [Linum trigynum]|uniref:Protein kinase domain-containing protein n=1 Tax=Linum trigynum TaxID=586398 RepID=A0AAV2EGF4_9ROSI